MYKTFEKFLESVPAPVDSTPAGPAEPAKAGPAPAGEPVAFDKAALVDALSRGDLDEIAELLDADPAKFDKATRKWAVAQRKISAAEARATAAEAAGAKWKPVEQIAESINLGQFDRVFDLLQAATGKDPDTLLTQAVRARAIKDPRVPELEKRVEAAEKKAKGVDETIARTAEQAYVEVIKDEVPKDHDVRQITGWARKVAKMVKASIDPDLGEPRLTAKRAADRLIRKEREAYERRATVFGGAPARPAKAPDPLARAGTQRGATVKPMTREDFFKQDFSKL